MKALRVLLVALAALAVDVLASGHAQTLLLTLDAPSPQAGAYFGGSLAVGEVDGDGLADIAVGASSEDVGGAEKQGRVYVFSGLDGSLLFTLDSPNPQAWAAFGCSVAVGDVDADGTGDVAVGAYGQDVASNIGQGRVYIFSGANGSLLFALDTPNPQSVAVFGHSVAVGDVDGDGREDVAVGAPGEGAGGRAYVFSGLDGSILFALASPNPQALFGFSLTVGDTDGDGLADIAVTALENVGGNAEQGRVYVFSGATGSLLFALDTPNPQVGAYFGHSSAAVGDVNGDGKGDIAVGAHGEDVGGNQYQGRVYAFSGADGSLLLTLDTPNSQASAVFGYWVAVGDVNGDGKGDIAVGAHREDVGGNESQGRVHVFSGADGSLLLTMDSPNPQARGTFGTPVAVGDVNGDGREDVAVGAPQEGMGGRAYVFSLAPTNQPPQCSAAAPSITEIWPPNHKMVDVNILGVTDPDGDPVSIVTTGMTQDESVNGRGDGDTAPDGAGVGTDAARVRAERAGTVDVPGDGRMYHIHFAASDDKGGTCSGIVKVGVPNDQRPEHVVVDGGELYDSTVP